MLREVSVSFQAVSTSADVLGDQQTYWETCISSVLSLFVHDIAKRVVSPIWLECLCLVPCLPGAVPACAMLGPGHCVPREHQGYSFHLEMFSLPLPGLLLVTLDMRGKVWGLPSKGIPYTHPTPSCKLLAGG